MRQDLYYLLSGLELAGPSLRERREDLEKKLEDTLGECCDRYGRYHVLTKGARQILLDYPWPGNLLQIESFCDRLVLTAVRRSLDEVAVKSLLAELYPEHGKNGGQDQMAGSGLADGPAQAEEKKGMTVAPSGNIYPDPGMDCSLAREEAQRIMAALRKNGGNRQWTAEDLGISKATLWRRMKKLGIR